MNPKSPFHAGRPLSSRPAAAPGSLSNACQALVKEVSAVGLATPQQLAAFLQKASPHFGDLSTPDRLGSAMVEAGLLTQYQLNRVLSGGSHGLVLGNYRILDRLGGGTVGLVFLGEHALLRRRVAVKVLPVNEEQPPAVLERFFAEMRVLAGLNHPHIVSAYDGGTLPSPEIGQPTLHYLVMEFVEGGDLEQHVYDHGVLTLEQGCEYVRQAAAGLQEAHDNHLIHRDLKPSNLLLTRDGRVKLVDFGLARQFTSNLTERSALLGSLEFMAPEQSLDPTSVGGQADVYGLGATLFWLVTGQTPYAPSQNVVASLKQLQTQPPRRLRDFLPDVPAELDEFVDKMLARDLERRPQMPLAVMKTLARFTAPAGRGGSSHEIDLWEDVSTLRSTGDGQRPASNAGLAEAARPEGGGLVLAAGGAAARECARVAAGAAGARLLETATGREVLKLAQSEPVDLVLLDAKLPDCEGLALCQYLRQKPPRPFLKVLVCGAAVPADAVTALGRGADDYLAGPPDAPLLTAKLGYWLRLKDAQDRAERLARHLAGSHRQLEQTLESRSHDVRQAHDGLLFGLARMAETRGGETTGHNRRLQRYATLLAERLQQDPEHSRAIDRKFLTHLARCVPLHDLGKIGLPDSVIDKPGPLDDREQELMEAHPLLGTEILESIARAFGSGLDFLAMARAIVRHHHERWDGLGYPDKLAGDAIPLAARVVAVADVYDALRRRLPHKPAMAHAEAVRTILRGSAGHFDPKVLNAFSGVHEQFQVIFQATAN